MLRQIMTCLYFIFCVLSSAQAEITSMSNSEIIGTAPYFKPGWRDSNGSWPVGTSENHHVGWKAQDQSQVGEAYPTLSPHSTVVMIYTYLDNDGDLKPESPYGQAAGTYFTLIDSKTGQYREIKLDELFGSEYLDNPQIPSKDVAMHALSIPYTWVGGQIGLVYTPSSQYGNPNIGATYKVDNPYQSEHILPIEDKGKVDSIIRISESLNLQVGIWDAADVTKQESDGAGNQQIIPTDPESYTYANTSKTPQLGKTYQALMWERHTAAPEEGLMCGFTCGDVRVGQIGTKTFYTWRLVKGNQPANGTVSTNTIITLVDRSTDSTITLPATNGEALAKWPNVGLPTDEAALQGFTLEVEVSWEFNLNDSYLPKTKQMKTADSNLLNLLNRR